MSAKPSAAYAELAARSNFSFLDGASHPDEMVLQAAALGLAGLGLADRNSCAGLVRAHKAAKEAGLTFRPGVRLILRDGAEVITYPKDRTAYGRLSKLLTLGNRRAPKGQCLLDLDDVLAAGEGQLFLALAPGTQGFPALLPALAEASHGGAYLGVRRPFNGTDRRHLAAQAALARKLNVPALAVQDALYHQPARRPLQDVLTAIRLHTTVDAAGFALEANADRHLKPPEEMARLFARHPEMIAAGLELLGRAQFSLDDLAYEYPIDGYAGRTPGEELAARLEIGLADRFPDGTPPKVQALIDHEMALIAQLNYAPYFLTVHDIVLFARSRGILCQGRGSAANSAVCYVLGITAVDPTKIDLLFERFVSAERNEPPDIDVDFEHERREEVIQWVYERYGRDRAGIAATVITYRARSAVREVGKAMGLSLDMVGALSDTVWGWSSGGIKQDHVRELGLDPQSGRLAQTLDLTQQLMGFPRHLSQHVGGFVITRGALDEVVPVTNAAMEDRTFVEWDKDDLDALGILKIDLLALGMLSCIRKAFDLLALHKGIHHDLASVPAEDPVVYDMICKADTLGVFQIESRAQMSMLPRLKPRCFYDLVIEVAIVRPGPIQGDMVHPYLRRRAGLEEVSFPSADLEQVLGKTLGVPLFQEQAMKIAIVAAGFTPAEADRLRRAMATFRKVGIIHEFGLRLVDGMVARGYDRDFAERCFRQIEGFGEYGFPESHAASFALLVYISCWLKCHHPEVFAAALLNAQPMGFYAPAQIVRDARQHGVPVRPVDVSASDWDCTLESMPDGRLALRLGFREIKGCPEMLAARIMAARDRPFISTAELKERAGLTRAHMEILARADAFRSLKQDRREALWTIKGLDIAGLPLFDHASDRESAVRLPVMSLGEHVIADYASLRLSLKAHPAQLLRPLFIRRGVTPASALMGLKDGASLTVAGLVLVRQRPGTAKGVIFATLEDETGTANVVIWSAVFEQFRKTVMGARLMAVTGKLQRDGAVIHVIARAVMDWSGDLAGLPAMTAPADEKISGRGDPREMAAARRDEAQRRAAQILYPSRDFH